MSDALYATDGIVGSTLDLFLRNERSAEGVRPTACGTGLRGSQAWTCDRQVGFAAARVAECEDLPYETLLAFHFGRAMHEKVQEALHALWGDFEDEVQIDLRPLGYDISGHADGVMTEGDVKTVVEIKTSTAYPFKLCMRDGPKIEHVLQAGIYAMGAGADAIHIVMICKDASYRDGIKPGMTLEFRLAMSDEVPGYGQSVESLVVDELTRLQRVWEQVQAGQIPGRNVPGFGYVDSVPSYMVKKGDPWNCRYCAFNSYCRQMPTGPVPVELAPAAVRESWNPPVADEAEVAA